MLRGAIHIILTFLLVQPLTAQRLSRVVDLRGEWRFEIGDDPAWSESGFDDGTWDRITVPGAWEDAGYPGYDGWAWYRTRFVLSSTLRHDALFLRLGNVDDIDEVHVNGRFVGFSGSAPPHYETAYAEERQYYLPNEYLRFGEENVVAVRVYDNELGGGILRGDIGVYRDAGYLVPDQSLRGSWRFATGDEDRRRLAEYDDSGWATALVPSFWETQGYRGYDGFAWYRREFRLEPSLRGQRLVLLLGRIDDVDEVWLNGSRVGKTGRMPDEGGWYIDNDSYRTLRAYFIPSQLLRSEGTNVIAVRVYDGFRHGGMYEGPVGMIRQQRYREWERTRKPDERNAIGKFLDAILGR